MGKDGDWLDRAGVDALDRIAGWAGCRQLDRVGDTCRQSMLVIEIVINLLCTKPEIPSQTRTRVSNPEQTSDPYNNRIK